MSHPHSKRGRILQADIGKEAVKVMLTSTNPNSSLAIDLVTATTAQRAEAALSTMLEHIAKIFEADSCVIWETSQSADDPANSTRGRLFALGAWFKENRIFAIHNMKMDGSLTGQAILEQNTLRCDDVSDDVRIRGLHPFFTQMGIRAMMTAPIAFLDQKVGGVNVYRTRDAGCFYDQDEQGLRELARVVPSLYQAIIEKVSLDLFVQVDNIMAEADAHAATSATAETDATSKVLRSLCSQVSETFHSLEVSIFLEDPLVAPGRYNLWATTWEGELPTPTLSPAIQSGATSWVILHQKPVRIFDWATFQNDSKFYQVQYPGLRWNDSLSIIKSAHGILGATLPPLSWMATPIFSGGHLVGVIRCTAGKLGSRRSGQSYFDERDLRLLQLVAGQIGRHWGARLNRQRINAEHESREARIFADLAHQLRGPLNQLHRRVEWLMDEGGRGNRKLAAIRGLSRKARRVTMSIDLLASSAEDNPLLQVALSPLVFEPFIKMLIEAAEDNELMIDPSRNIRFSVERESFNIPKLSHVYVDDGMLEQAINNLLDNARKYSFPNKTVQIFGGLTGKEHFHITISNEGLRIRPENVRDCIRRGWRSDEAARFVKGEGSGIGLWIVDQIMRAQDGWLEIVPTTKDGITQMKLVFPIRRVPPNANSAS